MNFARLRLAARGLAPAYRSISPAMKASIRR
jgi:hypothetical protein